MHLFIFSFKMRTMKSVIKTLVLPITMGILLILIFGVYIITQPPNYFHETFQSMIQDKYEILVNEKRPKIIILGGSSVAFGVNNQMLSEATGYPVANMGLHGGFYGLFNTEIAKANIGPGDIVLLAYEYEWQNNETYFEKLGVDLVMSGIDSKVEMYKYIPPKNYLEIIGYLPTYCTKKLIPPYATGAYCRDAFDENAQLIFKRDIVFENYDENVHGMVEIDGQILESSIEYLKQFKKYCEERGARVYFVAPPLYDGAKRSDDAAFTELAEKEESLIGIPYISNPLDYIYPKEYMYDTIYHCNSEGEIVRTRQLIQDLKEHVLGY